MTSLMLAAREGHVDTCKVLLDSGASVNKVDSEGNSSLHLACEAGHDRVVSLLLSHSGDLVDLKNVYNSTALQIALENWTQSSCCFPGEFY